MDLPLNRRTSTLAFIADIVLPGCMTATLHKVVAGNGYLYYLRNVAANDASARGRSSLADYYSTRGESPGRWHGAGLAALGIQPGEEVTEEQMNALFGLGRHPNADQIEDRVFNEEMNKGAKLKDAERAADNASRLGHPFRVYSDVNEFRKRCAQAYEAHNIAHGSDPSDAISDDERAQIRSTIATKMFTEHYGRAPMDARELSGWIARNSRPQTTAVAGFDVTFSPVKSVSVLWAIAPREVAEKVEAAHHAAVDDAVHWLEHNATFTRLGRNGVRQVDVEGLVAARFAHRESRAGDPDLHTHVLIANRVRTTDGRWRTLDGAMVYQAIVTVSEIYNTRLEMHLEEMVGVEFAERPGMDPSKRPIREIVGVPERLSQFWSQRDAAITQRLGQLTTAFQRKWGREPIPAELFGLMDRATLETRPDKQQLRTLSEQRADWRAQALTLLGSREALARMVSTVLHPPHHARPVADAAWIARTADYVLETISAQRSTWQRRHIRSETERQLRGQIHLEDCERVAEAVVAQALSPTSAIARGDPDIADQPRLRAVPMMFARRDGSSVYTTAGSQIYTSAQVLSAEQQLIDLAVQPGGRPLPKPIVTQAVRAYNSTNPDRPLNAGQIAVVEGFATSDLRVRTVDAPAGSGKTTAMCVLTDAWHANGGTVVGLAPTAAAASVLGESIGARVETIDKLLDVLTRHTPAPRDSDANRLPPSLPQWVLQIDQNTLVIIDEHVKVGNLKRLRLLQFLASRDATIRCLGDPKQLPSIEAGGAHTDMNDAANTHNLTLDHVVRFTSPAEASASLLLREGDPAALGFYLDHRRIHSGSPATTHDDAYIGWSSDHSSGRDTIMLAPTHDIVRELNQRARDDRIACTGTSVGPECALADGLCASVGDTIATRRNDPRLHLADGDWVRNGYRWIVSRVHDDGSLTVTRLRSRRELGNTVTLPPQYVTAHVRLGYAMTIDSAQGVTADTCHVALTGYQTRAQFYVAMTRGAHANHCYLPTTLDASEGSIFTEPAVFPRTAVEVLLRILGRDSPQKSAHTELRDALDPYRRIGRAVDIYIDAIGLAAEHALGPDELTQLDIAAEALHTGLTDTPAYPILRQHLATIALTGRDPIAALHTAAASRELDTADDAAAVLDWRLDPTGTHSCGVGPLPWTRGLPHALDDIDAGHLSARARIVTDLADQIRTDTATWSTTTAPHWARPIIGSDRQLLAELAVWRASLHIDDRDLRPTGPPRYPVLEREHQQLLDARVIDAIGDIHLPVNRWSPLAKQLDERITSDPYWPVLADKIDHADRAGIDIETLLSDAAALRPLPDEMPAAALWSRLELQTPTPNISDRPSRTADEPPVLDEHTTEQASTDPLQPHVGAAVDHTPDTELTLDALGMLNDAELEQHIDELHLHIALAETEAFIYHPYIPALDAEREAEAAARHQQAAKQAIRDAQTSINELRAAEQSLQAITTELDHARTTLSSTPAYRRGQRRALHTQITTLQTEQQHRTHARNSAHTTARNAQRDALLLAGPAEDWEHILAQPITEPTSTTPSEPAYADTLTAEYQQELDQLQSEQHRRTQLTATQTAAEQRLRQQHNAPEDDSCDYFDSPVEPHYPQPDHDLGL
ncbi:MobF family relaxase [Nocardia pseudovaccinii]|uniref:MobF family relaxase n=1 Tax=Nocardia pseudovaccinii TaxID=189540 RepID=UPI003D8D2BD9